MITEQSRQVRCIDSLRLSPTEQEEILQMLAERETSGDRSDRRREPRLSYQCRIEVAIQASHGPVAQYLVQTRNITSRGVGFLHGTFMYTGTVCSVSLPTLAGHVVAIRGQVVRCSLIRRNIHDIGIRFDKRIALAEFIAGAASDPENERPAGGAVGPLFSDLWTDRRLQPLIRSFLPSFRDQILEAGRLVTKDNSGLVLQRLCLEIKGSAAGYGYPRISALASQLLELVLSNQETAMRKQIMGELIELGRAASQAIDETR